MRLKRYIGIIVLLLVLVGAVKQQNIDVPNQEIVLQFTNTKLNSEDSLNAIKIVETELYNVGVHNFKVKENDKGVLKITYYSDADVDVVKRILTQRIRAELGADNDDVPLEFPFDSDTVSYNLDVHEIQNGSDSDSGLNGIAFTELNHKADRLFKPKHLSSTFILYDTATCLLVASTRESQKNIAIAIQNTLKRIPEVRAGPLC